MPRAQKKPKTTTVDPALRKAYDRLLKEIDAADRDAARGWDRKYEAAGEVLDKKLFLLSPYGTAEKWCQAVLQGDTYRTALRNVRVARYCSPEDEHKYGTAKLDAVLTYLDTKTHGLKAGSLKVDLEKLRIPVVEKKTVRRLRIKEASVKQILAAARGESAGKKLSRSPLEEVFVKPFAKDRDLKAVSVRVSDGTVHFGGVPLSALARFARIVREAKWEEALP